MLWDWWGDGKDRVRILRSLPGGGGVDVMLHVEEEQTVVGLDGGHNTGRWTWEEKRRPSEILPVTPLRFRF